MVGWLSPSQRLPLGIPIKIAKIEKIESARGTMGRGKRREKPFQIKIFFLLGFHCNEAMALNWLKFNLVASQKMLLQMANVARKLV